MILQAGSVSSKPVGTPPPQVGFDTIIPSYHWCLGKRCLFLSPQEKVQTTAVFCLLRECITSEDFCWSPAYTRSPLIGWLSRESHGPYTNNCQKVKWELALRISDFSKAKCVLKTKLREAQIAFGTSSLVYSVLFLLMNLASGMT